MGDFTYLYDDLSNITGDKSYLKNKPTPDTQGSSKVQSILNRMRGGESAQESGGKTNITNPDSGAAGQFQVMPANIPTWTKQHYGQSLTPEQFKNNSAAQQAVFNGEMGKYVSKALNQTNDEDTAMRMAAAGWYGGQGAMNRYDDPTPQFTNGRKYPSFRDYTLGVLNKSKATSAPDYSFANKDISDIIGDSQSNPTNPDYSFVHQDIADILKDNKGGQPISTTVQPKTYLTPADVGQVPPAPQTATPAEPVAPATTVTPPASPLAGADPRQLFNGNVKVAPTVAAPVTPVAAQPVSTPQTRPQAAQTPVQAPVGHSTMTVQDANSVVPTDEQGNELPQAQPQTPPMQTVNANQADDAVANTLAVKPNATSREVLQQLQAEHPSLNVNKVLAENPNLQLSNNNGRVDVTYGDLKRMGVDTTPLIAQKVAENRIQNPQPDLRRVPYDFAKTTADDINNAAQSSTLGYQADNALGLPMGSSGSLASAGLGQQIGSWGDFAGTTAGITRMLDEASPVTNAVKEIMGEKALAGNVSDWGKSVDQVIADDAKAPKAKRIFRDATADNLEEFYKNANQVMDQTGGKNPDGTPTVPTQIMRFGVKTGNDIARLATLSTLPGGAITGFALDGAALAKLHGGSASDVALAAVKGGLTGALFHFVPPAVKRLMGAGVDEAGNVVAESTANKVARAAVESGLVFGGSVGIGAAAGDPIKENLLNAALNTAFHISGMVPRALAGKTVHVEDVNGNQLYAEVKPDGTLETVKAQPTDYETLAPSVEQSAQPMDNSVQNEPKVNLASDKGSLTPESNPAIPTTEAEPEKTLYSSALDEIRQNKADTTAKVQVLFPDAQLTRQEAADLRRQAWDNGTPVDADVHIRAIAPDEVTTNGDLRNKLADQAIAEFDKQNETNNPTDVRTNAESTNGTTPSESVSGDKVSGTEPNSAENSAAEAYPVEKQTIRTKAESAAATSPERTEPVTGTRTAEPVEPDTTTNIREADKAERTGTGDVQGAGADKQTEVTEPPPKTPIILKEGEDKGVSKIGKSIEQKTIEKGLVDSFDRTAEYDKKTVDDQKEKVAKLVLDPERMRNIIRGDEELPRNIDRSMFIRGVELHADTLPKDEEVQLKYELGNSDIVRQTSEAAQTLRFAQEREQDSTTRAMQEIRKARIADVKNLLKGRDIETAINEEAAKLAKTVKGAKDTAVQKASTRQSWSKFIAEIKC